jgi:hypothetical protein
MDFPAIGYTQVGRSWPSSKHGGGTRAQQRYNRTSSPATLSTQYTCEESSLWEYPVYSRRLPYCGLPSLRHTAGSRCKNFSSVWLILSHREGVMLLIGVHKQIMISSRFSFFLLKVWTWNWCQNNCTLGAQPHSHIKIRWLWWLWWRLSQKPVSSSE